jgi:hypothetical protein
LKEVLKRFIRWVFTWQWAIPVIWFIALLEVIGDEINPVFHAISNWLILIVGGFLILGFIAKYAFGDVTDAFKR